jgi:hypothetical protein
VRSLIALALVLAACSGGDRSNPPATRTSRIASSTPAVRGPDALMLRVPRNGGVARVDAFPNVDSTLWTGTDAAPAIDRVLAFDAEEGLIAAADARGLPLWLDLRVGTVTRTGKDKPRDLISVDGSTIFGVGSDGAIARFTPSGNWVHKTPQPATAVFPQSNGTVLVLTGRGPNARVIRLHPPDTTTTASLALPNVTTGTGAPLGDRIYFVERDGSLTDVHARTLAKGRPISLGHTVADMAATPSGDRFYVITDSSTTLSVIDPIQERVSASVDLPGRPRDLRVDPFGRYVLVRAAAGDAVWIVSIGTDKVVGTLHSTWRGDLPFVAPDGSIATIERADVVFFDAASMHEQRRVANGAADFWYAFVWSGLRPRAQALDAPAQFPTDSDTVTATAPPVVPQRDTTKPRGTPPASVPAAADSSKTGFTVSFAALLDAARARDLATKIVVDGRQARVVTGLTAGTAVYRVVLGPYATREEAERVGRASGQSYYVYVGTP